MRGGSDKNKAASAPHEMTKDKFLSLIRMFEILLKIDRRNEKAKLAKRSGPPT